MRGVNYYSPPKLAGKCHERVVVVRSFENAVNRLGGIKLVAGWRGTGNDSLDKPVEQSSQGAITRLDCTYGAPIGAKPMLQTEE